ncbi:xylan 1,4-beta-xylosidase [Gluconacetobacter sacchari DSM 12717]|uniref:Glycosyl hydrolase family 39 n=2 Tax=Gluconacetobacter sacchari TaxID=92759 RepID=A0A7W4NRH1_9PROT|nr:glycosyl hydrolase [Gluconacetobacter sacchari]MBB2160170.1 glycosyl hydrolase family 39 [Gluconacetobacter sacchari]GBQ30266.1 xylan 1,4-beta-xylosidase [Gluconacetobacter sacchari DSM 12717]
MARFRTVRVCWAAIVLMAGGVSWSARAGSGVGAGDDPAFVEIDATGAGTPFLHSWEQAFGSDRADMALTESYLRNADRTRQATGFRYVRFHGIFDDAMGIMAPDGAGRMHYNFRKVDAVYDGLLAHHIRPLVELSFMPSAIGSDVLRRDGGLEPLVDWKADDRARPITDYSGGTLWYRANVTFPAHMADWTALIRAFVEHLEQRYGAGEVRQWPFEVWNEPNQATWVAQPKMATYFALYDNTARAIKAVDPALRVGGPATGAIHWVGAFVDHVTRERVPVDFVSTHIYANDPPDLLRLPKSPDNTGNVVCDATRTARRAIDRAGHADLPLYITEFGADWDIHNGSADRPWVAPWIAQTVHDCDGLAPIMSYWTFSDDFEEQGVAADELPGAYGLLTTHGIPKPAFNAFALLHRLGNRRLPTGPGGGDVLATRRQDGVIAVALWNRDADKPRARHLAFRGLASVRGATVIVIDRAHGTPAALFEAMGRPASPTPGQARALMAAARLPAPRRAAACGEAGRCDIMLPPESLALLLVPARTD